jgi:N-acetylglucosaminyldiphosphoundecaprenol N-acetyl-beta-D-mannosaminyltransferase
MTKVTAEGVPNSLSILGTRVSVFDPDDEALHVIRRRISSRQPTFCVALNPEKVYRASHDPQLSQVLDSAHIRICDGVGISLAAMLLYRQRLPRCTGIDLFLRLIRLSVQEGWGLFLLGASPEINSAACRALLDQFPGLKIVGSQDGYFRDSAPVVESINQSGADLLFVALGSPRQEFWISEQMHGLQASFCMGVGGSLDVVSGAVKRAPTSFRKTGTEWLYRLIVQPSRLRRQMVLPLFALGILRSAIGLRKSIVLRPNRAKAERIFVERLAQSHETAPPSSVSHNSV